MAIRRPGVVVSVFIGLLFEFKAANCRLDYPGFKQANQASQGVARRVVYIGFARRRKARKLGMLITLGDTS